MCYRRFTVPGDVLPPVHSAWGCVTAGSQCLGMCYRRFTVPGDVLPPVHSAWGCVTAGSQYCRAHRTACPMNTPIRTLFFKDKIVHWTRGRGDKGFKGRPFPGEVVQTPDAVRPQCVNCPNDRKSPPESYSTPVLTPSPCHPQARISGTPSWQRTRASPPGTRCGLRTWTQRRCF